VVFRNDEINLMCLHQTV